MADKPVEVLSWDPADHTDLPGFAHGLTRYGSHWIDIGISVVPVDVDPLEALDKVFGTTARDGRQTRTRSAVFHRRAAGGFQDRSAASRYGAHPSKPATQRMTT